MSDFLSLIRDSIPTPAPSQIFSRQDNSGVKCFSKAYLNIGFIFLFSNRYFIGMLRAYSKNCRSKNGDLTSKLDANKHLFSLMILFSCKFAINLRLAASY